ncbi:hypothetical protein ACIRRA_03665 [Nocardia sp. NPDC101769]
MSPFRAFRWGEQVSAATVFADPAALWNWAELAVPHGRGPGVRDLIG